jgi:hypothetical protein
VSARADPARVTRIAGWTGGGGLAVSLLGFVFVPATAVRSWLGPALFFIGLSLGALLLLLILNIVSGRWGRAVRAPLERMAGLTPVFVIALLPPLIGMGWIFAWLADPQRLGDKVEAKLAYLDAGFLLLRTVASGAAWLAVLWAFAGPGARLRRYSPVGLVIYAVTLTFFATDWMRALDPTFYSTIYGMLEAGGELAGAFAAAVLALYLSGYLDRREESAPGILVAEDLANLLFGFILLWVYLAFMQWLIVWSGNLPDEIAWYLERSRGIWLAVLLAIIALHAVLPVCASLRRPLKRSPRGLAAIAACVLVGHFLDVVWRVAPAFGAPDIIGLVLIAAATAGIGGLGLAGALRFAGGPLLFRRRADG